jgi:hypothetical protein
MAHSTQTGPDGTHRFDYLPNGTYQVDWELRGFDVVVAPDSKRRMPIVTDDSGFT